jgi:CRISPR-associated protein Cas1
MNDLAPPRPIPIKERLSMLFIEKGQLDVLDGAFVVIDINGVRTYIPVGSVTCLMLEPGTRVSHAAVKLASYVGCLLVWVGEAGVRLYAAGQPGGARADRLLYQARLALDDKLRLKVVRKMYEQRFGECPPANRSINQLRGIEAARVKELYKQFAKRYGVEWNGRNYDPKDWQDADLPNKSLSAATACLYGVTEAAILAAGYAPAIGFLHTGKPQSFVYDIADILKFDTVVPIAFEVAGNPKGPVEKEVRHKCRDAFRRQNVLQRLIPLIEEVLEAGEMAIPKANPEALPVAIPEEKGHKDVGHRN